MYVLGRNLIGLENIDRLATSTELEFIRSRVRFYQLRTLTSSFCSAVTAGHDSFLFIILMHSNMTAQYELPTAQALPVVNPLLSTR